MPLRRTRTLPLVWVLLAVFAAAAPCPARAAEPAAADGTLDVDVVVVGATPAGVAAAVAAARGGARVAVLEESSHVGGIVAGGLTNTDIRKHGAVGGLYTEFKRRIVEHYVAAHGADSADVRLCRGGNMFSPRVAERVFREMLSDERTIRLLERHRVVAATVGEGHGGERPATPTPASRHSASVSTSPRIEPSRFPANGRRHSTGTTTGTCSTRLRQAA